jgi:hypothetical protein
LVRIRYWLAWFRDERGIIGGYSSSLVTKVEHFDISLGLQFPLNFEFIVLPFSDFVLGIGHMPHGFPCIFLMTIAKPFDKEMSLSINNFFINYLFDLERKAVCSIKHAVCLF